MPRLGPIFPHPRRIRISSIKNNEYCQENSIIRPPDESSQHVGMLPSVHRLIFSTCFVLRVQQTNIIRMLIRIRPGCAVFRGRRNACAGCILYFPTFRIAKLDVYVSNDTHVLYIGYLYKPVRERTPKYITNVGILCHL